MLHQCRLAGAGMTDDTDKLAPFHAEGNILQGNMLKGCSLAVDMMQILYL
jgi:hypothetical protein